VIRSCPPSTRGCHIFWIFTESRLKILDTMPTRTTKTKMRTWTSRRWGPEAVRVIWVIEHVFSARRSSWSLLSSAGIWGFTLVNGLLLAVFASRLLTRKTRFRFIWKSELNLWHLKFSKAYRYYIWFANATSLIYEVIAVINPNWSQVFSYFQNANSTKYSCVNV